jgi:DNA topoisomerase IA
MAGTKETTSEKHAGEDLAHPPVIVDLGQKTPKKINKLKKGEGPLYDAVCQTVETLQSDGVVGKQVQVVVVVVERLPDGIVFPNLPWS